MASGTFHCSSQEQPGVTSANTRPSSREIRRAGKAKQQAIIVALRRQLHEYDQKFAVMEMVIRDQQLEIHSLDVRLGRAGCHNALIFDLYDRPDVHDAATLTDISQKIGDSNASCVPPTSVGLLDTAEGGKLAQSEFVVEQVTASPCGPEVALATAEVEPLPDTAAVVATSGRMVGMLIHKPTVQYIDKRVPNKVIQYTDKYPLTSACGCFESGFPAQPCQPVTFNILDGHDSADVAAGNALEHSMDSNGTPGHIKAAEPPGAQVPVCADFAHNSKIEKSRASYSEGGDDNETQQSQCGRQATVHHRPCATFASPELIDTSFVDEDFNSQAFMIQCEPSVTSVSADPPESEAMASEATGCFIVKDSNSQALAPQCGPSVTLEVDGNLSGSVEVVEALEAVTRALPQGLPEATIQKVLEYCRKFATSEFFLSVDPCHRHLVLMQTVEMVISDCSPATR